jgi:soluble lytic murein transglycosylase-like protein
MSIDPAGITSIVTFVPKLYETASEDGADAPDPSTSQSPGQSELDGIENNFSAIVSQLSKQLAALERTFSQAMRDLAKGYRVPAKPQAARAEKSAASFTGTIESAASRNELDPALLSAVIRQESGFHPRAVSSAGAMGLMQLMPGTARDLGVRDPFDPEQNVEGGAKYLRGLIDRYHGRLDLALAAYNAGPGAVDTYGGVPPFAETQAYVHDVLSAYRGAALAS